MEFKDIYIVADQQIDCFNQKNRELGGDLSISKGKNFKYITLLNDSLSIVGGYGYKEHVFCLNGKSVDLRNLASPVVLPGSKGMLGFYLIRHATKEYPYYYGLGGGGAQQASTRMLRASKWSVCEVPFYFYINKPHNFFKKLPIFRKTKIKKILAQSLAYSGVGKLFVALFNGFSFRFFKSISYENIKSFGSWSDKIWYEAKKNYSLVRDRSSSSLGALYSLPENHFQKLKIFFDGDAIGWGVFLVIQSKNHRHFGDLKVGAIIDCVAYPSKESLLIKAALKFFKDKEVDVVVTNMQHKGWIKALKNNRFLKGPSNFSFALSPGLVADFKITEDFLKSAHVTRIDGDGPIGFGVSL